MSWDSTWEKVFQEREWGNYPPEELIRFIAGNFYQAEDRESIRILDAGCGTGASTWYLAREGFSAYGIDGSRTAITLAEQRLKAEGLKAEFAIGDLVKLPYPDEYFDGVIDIACVECNTLTNIKQIIREIYRVLRFGGKFFSMAVSVGSYGYGEGDRIERNTFTNIKVGPYNGQGKIHFFTEPEIRRLLASNEFKNVEVERSARTVNNQKTKIVHWVVTAQK